MKWATVTQVSPLRIRFDGEDTLPITPDTLVPVAAGDRVLVEHVGTQPVIVGRPEQPLPANVLRVGSQLVQWGTIVGTGTATIWTGGHSFVVPFSSAPVVTLGSPDNNADSSIIYNVRSRTAAGFTWSAQWLDKATPPIFGASHSGAGTASWIAIGPA